MKALVAFLKRKDIEIPTKRYDIDTLAVMAQGLFCSLLIGTVISAIDAQLHPTFLTSPAAAIVGTKYTVGGLAPAMSGPVMATTTGWALRCPPLVFFSLIAVGLASNTLGGAGGPLAVLFVVILTVEVGKAVSREVRADILVTPLVTTAMDLFFSALLALAFGKAATKVGDLVMQATKLQPFLMGILVLLVIGTALMLPISLATICAALGLAGLVGDAASAGCRAQMVGFAVISYPENGFDGPVSQGVGTSMLQMGNIVRDPEVWTAPCVASMIAGPIVTCVFHLQQNGAATASGMGTCGFVGPFGVYTGWVRDVVAGQRAAITSTDWLGMLLVAAILPAILYPLIHMLVRRIGLMKDGDLKLA